MKPRIILTSGWLNVPGAIVADHTRMCFWKDGERFHTRSLSRRGSYVTFRLVTALLLRSPHLVEWKEITEHCWRDREDGGPLDPGTYAWVTVCLARKQLDWLGVRVKGVCRRGLYLEFVDQSQEIRRAA